MELKEKDRINLQKKLNAKEKLTDNEIDILNDLLDNTKLGIKLYFSEKKETIKKKNINDYYYLLNEAKNLEIKNSDKKSNLLIEGENYFALKHLIKINQKVDIIYIDPPYNTKNKDFIYNDTCISKDDKFKHSKWLSFMKKRLNLAWKLLEDDGIIFVSIDDNEQSYLKLLMDEIFGEENFVSCIVRRINKGKGNDSSLIVKEHDYILIYSKNKNNLVINSNEIYFKSSYRYIDEYFNIRGKYQKRDMYAKVTYSKNLDFPLKDPEGNYVYAGYVSEKEYKKRILNNKKRDFNWIWNEKRIINSIENGFAFWEKKNNIWKIYKKIYWNVDKNDIKIDRFSKITSIYDKGTNSEGTKELKEIIFNNDFTFPKPISLIKYLIKLKNKKNDVILDFFAGSGTTGHAVMDLNKEDNGNRQFILITNNENNIAKDICYERLYRIINGIGTKKEKDFKWLEKNKPYLKENLKYLKLKLVDKINGNYEEIESNSYLYNEICDKKDFNINDIV